MEGCIIDVEGVKFGGGGLNSEKTGMIDVGVRERNRVVQ